MPDGLCQPRQAEHSVDLLRQVVSRQQILRRAVKQQLTLLPRLLDDDRLRQSDRRTGGGSVAAVDTSHQALRPQVWPTLGAVWG